MGAHDGESASGRGMTDGWRLLIGVFGTVVIVSLLYVSAFYRAAVMERRRRRQGLGRRLPVHIHPPGSGRGAGLVSEWRVLTAAVSGLVGDQPRALPLIAALIVGVPGFLVLIDPILSEPLLWAGIVPAEVRGAMPGWLRLAWLAIAIALALGHLLFIWYRAPSLMSRHWLVLNDDGVIEARGAALPALDPAHGFDLVDELPPPRGEAPPPETLATVITQGAVSVAFVYLPGQPRWYQLLYPGLVPADWWRIDFGPDFDLFDDFLDRHYRDETGSARRPPALPAAAAAQDLVPPAPPTPVPQAVAPALDLDRHILVVYAGGTIGMRPSPEGLVPQDDLPAVLAGRLAPLAGQLPRFSFTALAQPIDSAEATPADWGTIARVIAGHWHGYDGFVVLHGTDTMAYTASALSFLLRGIDKPVIVTGAQLPLEAESSDALGNVVAALGFAACDIPEVCLCFDRLLLRGNRATKISSHAFAGFGSPNHAPLARLAPRPALDLAALDAPVAELSLQVPAGLGRAHVLCLRMTPGFPAAVLDAVLAVRPDALVLECYGSGTVPSLDGHLAEFLQRARRSRLPVVALSQAAHGGTRLGTYAAGNVLLREGVIDGHDMTVEAAVAKLHVLIAAGLTGDDLARAVGRDLAGELSAPPA